MSFFSIKEYLLYRIKARGRHGTHSPFVYAFVEDILRGHAVVGPPPVAPLANSPHSELLNRIAAYYRYNSVLHLHPGDTLAGTTGQYDIITLSSLPGDWAQQVTAALPLLADGGMLVLTGIHSTPLHVATWHAVHSSSKVMMSIEMFHTGFIFKSPSFLRKQHFVIK